MATPLQRRVDGLQMQLRPQRSMLQLQEPTISLLLLLRMPMLPPPECHTRLMERLQLQRLQLLVPFQKLQAIALQHLQLLEMMMSRVMIKRRKVCKLDQQLVDGNC
jgi:hypothetical protein